MKLIVALALAVFALIRPAHAALSDEMKQAIIASVQSGDYSVLDQLDEHHDEVCTITTVTGDASLPVRPANAVPKPPKKTHPNPHYAPGYGPGYGPNDYNPHRSDCAPGHGVYTVGCDYDEDGGPLF